MRTQRQAQAARIDPFDVSAFEQSVNDSAQRVSRIWLGYLLLGAYLAASVVGITHRQLLLIEPVRLPVVSLEMPLGIFAVIGPIVLILAHAYLLFQVVVLARTASAYNDALARAGIGESAQARVRYRLKNTLFAQLFAGSPREREGPLGFVLRLIALITLSVLPIVLLLAIQATFLPIHSAAITWSHRFLVMADAGVISALWPSVLNPNRDVAWADVLRRKYFVAATLLAMIISTVVLSFPGEPHAKFSRYPFVGDEAALEWPSEGCRTSSVLQAILPASFDRLSVRGLALVPHDRLASIEAEIRLRDLFASESRRSQVLAGRDLRCIDLEGSDLRYADFRNAELEHANLRNALLDGAHFGSARLPFAFINGASLVGASLSDAHMPYTWLWNVKLQDAFLENANLRQAQFFNAILTGAVLTQTALQGADLRSTRLAGANFFRANLQAAQLNDADARATMFNGANLQGVDFTGADLRGSVWGVAFAGADMTPAELALLDGADLSGADFTRVRLQAASLEDATLKLADLSRTRLWKSVVRSCAGAHLKEPEFAGVIEEEDNGQVPMTPERLAKIREEAGANFFGPLREGWEKRLNAILDASNSSETLWQTCGAAPLDDDAYNEQLGDYLASLPCEQDQLDGRFVLEGLVQSRYGWLDWAPPNRFSRTFIGAVFTRSESGCSAVQEVRASTREKLLGYRRFLRSDR